MKNDINDIKTILQEEKTQEKTEKELFNNLVGHLYNIFNEEIRPDLLERGFQYFSYNKTRQEVCNDLAETQKEYNYYFMNYSKALKQVKNFFAEDIKRQKEEEKSKAYCIRCGEKITINDKFCYKCGANQTAQEQKTRTKREKKKHTIFGVNPVIAILFLPLVLFFTALDHTK